MTALAVVAAKSEGISTTGETLGLIALGIFLVFAIWIIVQRMRHGRRPHD